MLSVLVAGLPLSAKDLVVSAMNEVYGEGVVEIVELTKDNLRQRVRLTRKNVSELLVVLDRVSTDSCKDIENGLYSSEKFHTYTDDLEFVNYLNTKYDIHLVVAVQDSDLTVDAQKVPDTSYDELVESYESKIRNKDLIIRNLKNRLTEIEEEMEELGSTSSGVNSVSEEEFESLKADNTNLRSQVLDLENQNSNLTEQISTLEKERDSLKESIQLLEEKRKSIFSDYESAVGELTDLRLSNTQKTGVIRNKEDRIKELESQLALKESTIDSMESLQERNSLLEKKISELSLESSRLNIDLDSKQSEIDRLKDEVSVLKLKSDSSDLVEKLKKDLSSISSERDSLRKELDYVNDELSKVKVDFSNVSEKLEELQQENSKLKERIESDNESISLLNQEKLSMQGKLSVLEKSTSRDKDFESIMSELTDIRRKYDTLSMSVFSKISSYALPKGSTPIMLLKGLKNYNNIEFVFSGSKESCKGTYRCLLDRFIKDTKGTNYLLVDLVSETSVDYVFEIKKVVSGIDWFRKGGSVLSYLSSTRLKSVSVLSPGLGYINDSYFLSINWEKRLSELENSGYKVILFCGDISNIVGRVLHESFADLGESTIYVHGNAVGSRSVVANLRGLTNSKKSKVFYFDFNPQMQKFYDFVSKTNSCSIVNTSNR